MNSDYYPLIQQLLQTHYPDRFNLLNAGEAWQLMLKTPRHYQAENIFTDWASSKSVPCPNLCPNLPPNLPSQGQINSQELPKLQNTVS